MLFLLGCFIDFSDLVIWRFTWFDRWLFPFFCIRMHLLELACNARTRYVFGLWRFDHIIEFSRGILDYTLFEYLDLRLACFIDKIGLVGRCLISTLFLYLVDIQGICLSWCHGDSTVYRGIRLRNVLPSAAKSCRWYVNV
jgi:hypothetical protein